MGRPKPLLLACCCQVATGGGARGPGTILLPLRPPEGLVPTLPQILSDGEHFILIAYDPKAASSTEGGYGIYLAAWYDGKWTRS
jgi:hypothetical protein